MAKNNNLTDFLTDLSNTIKNHEGTSELINPQDFSSIIQAMDNGFSFKNYATDYITKTSTTTLNNIFLNCGFKPKIFYMRNSNTPYSNNTSTPYIIDACFSAFIDEKISLVASSFILKGNSSNPGRGGTSINTGGTGNGFVPTDTGLQGSGNQCALYQNCQYQWFAWG